MNRNHGTSLGVRQRLGQNEQKIF